MTKVAVLDDWQGVAKTSADWAPSARTESPTAVHAVGEMQETPLRELPAAPAGP